MNIRIIGLTCLLVANVLSGYQPTKGEMLDDLHAIRGNIRVTYAPAEWKEEQFGWNLDAEVAKLDEQIVSGAVTTVTDYQKGLVQLFRSFRDYHCWVDLYRTEYSTLPFTVRSAEGRYFLVHIDRDRLPKSAFPYEIGDEVLSFDAQPVGNLIDKLRDGWTIGSTAETDQAMAELMLTRRFSRRFIADCPQKPVTVELKTKQHKVGKRQVAWTHKPERIKALESNEKPPLSFFFQQAVYDPWELSEEQFHGANPHLPSVRTSMLPKLGEVIWEGDKDSPFESYVYRHTSGKRIGFLRIPHYSFPNNEWKQLADTIKQLEKQTDALVIDQLNNYGGYVFFCYGLASMLTDRPLDKPIEQYIVTQEDVNEALNMIPKLEGIRTDKQAKEFMKGLSHHYEDGVLMGIPVDYNFVQLALAYLRFTVDEWNAGRTLTQPFFRWGVDAINPSPHANYTKPILLLINELDISCGDFFPAIMQDNKRAKLLGVRTSGAGGAVQRYSHPNLLGIKSYHLTCTLLHRQNGDKIENLGVKPDIEYTVTVEDRQQNFKPFVRVINSVLAQPM